MKKNEYVSMNPLTIKASVLRGRAITTEQAAALEAHSFTEAELKNVEASVCAHCK